MPDITCCQGKGCNLKKYCYRFTALKNPYQQAYFTETPKLIKDDTCDYWIKTPEYFKNKATPEEVEENFNKILERDSIKYGEGYTHDRIREEEDT